MIDNIKIGDFVTRILAGCIEMQLKVTDLTENKVVCGSWEFCRQTGLEMDDDIERKFKDVQNLVNKLDI